MKHGSHQDDEAREHDLSGCTEGMYRERTWIQQKTAEMPQLQSIDEVVEVLEPLEEAVSIPVEALMSEARWEVEKEQQIYVNIEMYDEVRRTGIDAQDVYMQLWIPSDEMEQVSTERNDNAATNEANEEGAYVVDQ